MALRGQRNMDRGDERIEDAGERRRAARGAWGLLVHSMLLGAAVTLGTLLLP